MHQNNVDRDQRTEESQDETCNVPGIWCVAAQVPGIFLTMNYRKLYAKHYGITIPPEYDVHHIDFNRNNNDIKNLILLPKELHQRIHNCSLTNGAINTNDLFRFSCCANQLWDSIMAQALKDAANIYADLQYWASCREMELLRLGNNNGPMYFSYNQFRNDV